jgi:hypothetical protein
MLARRRLLEAARLGLFGLLAAVVGGFRGRPARAEVDGRSFTAYLDALIPDDEGTPGAVQLGIDRQLIDAADAEHAGEIEQFCRWLEERARAMGGRSFAELSENARNAILGQAESAAPDALPGRVFRRTRLEALTHYYADARSWPAIGYGGPPQPAGFPDYARAPEPRR